MKYIKGFTSENKREKFINHQNEHFSLKHDLSFNSNPKTMAVMLDLEGVTDDIDLDGASIFIRELEELRRRFQVKYCYICISTHSTSVDKVRGVLKVLNIFTTKNIVIGKSFLYGYTYDFYKDELTKVDNFFNINKIDTFKNYYLNNYNFNNVWFLICDDSLSENAYLRFKDIHPCLFITPGKEGKSNLMNLYTSTKGFDGVIESLDVYIRNTKKKSLSSIKNIQKNMLIPLSSASLIDKIRNHEFDYLIKYFEGDYGAYTDYYDALSWILIIIDTINKDEIKDIYKLLDIINDRIENNLVKEKILECKSKLNIDN